MWTMTIVVAALVFVVVRRRAGERVALWASLLVVGVQVDPFLAAVAAVASGLHARRRSGEGEPAGEPVGDLQALSGALVVGAAAGLSLQASLAGARAAVGPRHGSELEVVLRSARHIGLATALARADGTAAPLFGRLARAQVSGAPLAATVAAFATEERDARRAVAIEAARTLPVRLTIPLALLVLPGFLLLTAGPAAVGSIQRLLGPLLP
jgi:hypothetical protein